jgi:adenylate cyclase
MDSNPTVAQRLGRVLERLTRQSGRLDATPAYGSLLLGKVGESPHKSRVRIQIILTLFIITVNLTGMGVMVLLLGVAFSTPNVFTSVPVWLPAIVGPAYMLLALIIGTWWITGRTTRDLRWSIESRPPTLADQRNVFLTPWRIASAHLVLWGLGAALLTTLYGMQNPKFIPRVGLVIPFCGVLVTTGIYLVAEFALRPVAAQALAAGPPPHRATTGIMGRTITIWMLSSGLPMIGIGLAGLFPLVMDNMTGRELGTAILVTASISLVFGFILMWVLAWLTSTPVRAVRAALQRVEDGDLDSSVVVFDGTELGELQRGFNSMVVGLRERERVRDLFGRHVGRDVAAAAERQQPKLGGEERHVAALFVDIVGSTKLVASRPPMEVVELLNRFFAVIVEEVDRHHGLVNKFEGDAVLAVFGAPVLLENPEDKALAATRAISDRLVAEVPECPARFGIAAGQVVAGNVGARERFEYTVIGGPVNEAARLSELARSESTRILTTASTVAAASVHEQRHWQLGDSVQLRGYPAPVRTATIS